jgi:hypothetical protein
MNLPNPSAPTLDGFIDRLQLRLNARATAATREWWMKYLRGAASFRGVKMGMSGRPCTPGARRSTSPLDNRRNWP